MQFTTPVNIKPNKSIDHNSRIVMLGSCFAENIGKKLIECGFNVVMNPMGILYNPIIQPYFYTYGITTNHRRT